MRPWQQWSGAVIILTSLCAHVRSADDKPKEAGKRPRVEVVFCLDTTGSMGGLLEGAKQKIWAVSNQIANGKPVPQVKLGLVAYRDRGDAYVTQVVDLTEDLDAIHEKLRGFQAAGGGDEPESVNQALHESVTRIGWSKEPGVLKLLFLVGDAPPQMDYKDDVKYEVTCKLAAERGIIINTIQCGGNANCTPHWRAIAAKAEGSYAQIAQDGGAVVIATPFDEPLSKINVELSKTILVYANPRERAAGEALKEAAGKLPPGAAADRVAYCAKDGYTAANDLCDLIKNKHLKWEEIKKEDLPQELRKLTSEELKKHLDGVDKKRDELRKQALELDKQRGQFIAQKLKEEQRAGGKKDSFDDRLLEMLRKQATRHKIVY